MPRFIRTKRIITIIVWIAIAFLAIVKLPNLSPTIDQVNQFNRPQAQIARSSSLLKAQQIQSHWGRRLNHTQAITLVYSHHNRKITGQRQNEINQSLIRLHRRRRSLGIRQINDLNTAAGGADDFRSPDQTVETARLHVTRNAPLRSIYRQAQSKGMTVRLTSSRLLQSTTTHRVVKDTAAITIVGLLLSSLLIGIYFRSIFLPIISMITLFVTDIVSLSVTAQLARKKLIGFTNLTPVAILLITIIIGTFLNIRFYQEISRELPRHRDPNYANHDALVKVRRSFLTTGLIMTAVFCIPDLFSTPQLRSLPSLGITSLTLTLAILTIIPGLASQLGHELNWPGHYRWRPTHHRSGNRLTRLSLWQPIVSLIILLYTVVPLAYSYHNNLNYSLADYLPHSQAQRGSDQLQAHFTAGKPQPVTIWLHNSKPFDHNVQLQPLDQLTVKLQSMPGVNSVSSLTQPDGMPVRKYYLRHQLASVNLHLNQAQNHLAPVRKQLKKAPRQLKARPLRTVTEKLDRLKNLNRFNQHPISDRIGPDHGNAKLDRQMAAYQRAADQLDQNLNQLHDQLDTNLDGANDQLHNYRIQIQKLSSQIRQASHQAEMTDQKLNHAYNYLDGLQNSSTAKAYYITPGQLNDTDFQQSLINFASRSKRSTRLQVVFNQSPSTKYNQHRIAQLKNEIQTQLQGTNLHHDQIGISGQPVEQAQLQHGFKSGALLTILISGALFAVVLTLLSRSILRPLSWLFSLGLSYLAGLQLTELIFSYAIGQRQFNWQILMITSMIILGAGALILIPFSLSYRQHRLPVDSWLLSSLTRTGQQTRILLCIIIAGTVSLCLGHEVELIQAGSIITLSILIFSLIFPLLTGAVGKLIHDLPHSRI